MIVRALIVLLVVLNLGVAVWWTARNDDVPAAPAGHADAVARLRLVSELPAGSIPRTPPVVAQPASEQPVQERPVPEQPVPEQAIAPPDVADAEFAGAPADPAAAAERCYAVGPFDDARKLRAARAALQARVVRLHERSAGAAPARGWRVTLPVQGDREAAHALATRIAAAGFDDFFIVAGADDANANAIALGRYGGEGAARLRESALRAAGFADVRAEPLGGAAVRTWIDVAAPRALSAAAVGTLAGAAAPRSIDCSIVP